MKQVLLAVLILILCLSCAYIALEGRHDCHGEAECPICKIIAVISTILVADFLCFVAVLCFFRLPLLLSRVMKRRKAPSTLIALGVKLSY